MNSPNNIGLILRALIGMAYVILGVLLLISAIDFFNLNNLSKKLFALLLISYGSFRLYRAIKLKNEEH